VNESESCIPLPGRIDYERLRNVRLGTRCYSVAYRYGTVLAVTYTIGSRRYGSIWTSDREKLLISFRKPVPSVAAVKDAAARLARLTDWNYMSQLMRPGGMENQCSEYKEIIYQLYDKVLQIERSVYESNNTQ